LKTVGYREVFDYLEGNRTYSEMIEQIKVNTRRYAKRQITWFSKENVMPWFNPEQKTDILNYILKNIR
jgi:tRNA dimethylallyltransferase